MVGLRDNAQNLVMDQIGQVMMNLRARPRENPDLHRVIMATGAPRSIQISSSSRGHVFAVTEGNSLCDVGETRECPELIRVSESLTVATARAIMRQTSTGESSGGDAESGVSTGAQDDAKLIPNQRPDRSLRLKIVLVESLCRSSQSEDWTNYFAGWKQK